MVRNRILWIDAARGIGIILVVIGHVERGLVSAHLAAGSLWQWMDYSLYTFHMPLFFFLAGLNVPRALKKGASQFLRNKVWTIAYPYFLWSIIQGAILISLSSVTNGTAHVADLLQIGWAPMSQFWFLYVLMICQVMAFIFKEFPDALAPLAVLSLMASYIFQDAGVITQILHSFPFFAAGILLSGNINERKAGAESWLMLAILPVFIGLSGTHDNLNFNSAWTLPATIWGIASVVLVSQSLTDNIQKIFTALGAASMTIYILHILAASGTRIAMKMTGIMNPWLYLCVCTVVGVVVPYILHKQLKKRDLLAPLGLAARKPLT